MSNEVAEVPFPMLAAQEAEMAALHPDYHDAIEFLRLSRQAELIDLGAPAEDVDQIIAQEFVAGIAEANRNGLNPAKVAFKLACDRGFRRQAARISKGDQTNG